MRLSRPIPTIPTIAQHSRISKQIPALLIALSLFVQSAAYADLYEVRQPNGTILLTNIPQANAKLVQKNPVQPNVAVLSRPTMGSAANQFSQANQMRPYLPSANVTTINRYMPSPDAPSVINYSRNQLENVSRQTLGGFLTKWRSENTPVVIAHFGDSHIQTGWQIAPIRNLLQQARGNGGRGMIFPYSLAKTYSQEDYTSRTTGEWRSANSIQHPPKLGVGVSGFVGVTARPYAQVNFDFKDSQPALGNIRATLYYRAIEGNYQVSMGNGVTSRSVNLASGSRLSQASFDLPNTGHDITLTINRTSGSGEFELHGVSLAAMSGGGVIYHNLGVGGAVYKALLQQQFFDQQFTQLGADMVILDWGTNDILFTNRVDDNLEATIRQTIHQVRSANPAAAIVLTTPQEPRYHRSNVTAAAELASLIRRIAQEENCLLYDWYKIAGGSNAMNTWQASGYASKDAIHLNGKGYRVHGEMFAHAILEAIQSIQ